MRGKVYTGAVSLQVLRANPGRCSETPGRIQILDFWAVEHISLFNHPCFTLVSVWAVLSWGSGDTKDLEKDSFLGTGPAEDRGCGTGHVSPCTRGRALSAVAPEAPSGRLCKHEAVVKVPGAQLRGETFGRRQSRYTGREVGEFFFPIKSSAALIRCSCREAGLFPPSLVCAGRAGMGPAFNKLQ